ncbi:MAG: hypothetical protein IIC10_05250 [Proteobacteria bacterium]|nr:hypothetical protein [Pseudomonadota bacterium]
MTSKVPASDYSLQSRLLISFSVLLFVFLGLTGLVLDSAFRNSIEAGAADRLQVQVYLLLAAADEEDGEFYFLEDLQEPRFGQLDSGLYGFISRPSLGELWRSPSALALSLSDPQLLRQPIGVGETLFTRTRNDEGEDFFVFSYGILWEDGISEYSFSVMENAGPYYSEISNFRTSLWSWLGGVAVLLLLIQFFLMRWGLSPLQRMARDLKLIESGSKNQLLGDYPRELRGVTNNLNLLIETERKQQARYRTTLADLAHSLKTPLAVITGVLQDISEKPPSAREIDTQLDSLREQLERMNQIVTYQLQRAVQSGSASSLARQVSVAATVNKVLEALRKVYAEKSIHFTAELDPKVYFQGDERDLMEVIGNVMDNAFKYSVQRVAVAVGHSKAEKSGVEITVEDDGPGIPQDQQEFVLQRGARADTLVQGHGIGLAVVTDIVNSYGGEILLEASELGGARLVIVFPGPAPGP